MLSSSKGRLLDSTPSVQIQQSGQHVRVLRLCRRWDACKAQRPRRSASKNSFRPSLSVSLALACFVWVLFIDSRHIWGPLQWCEHYKRAGNSSTRCTVQLMAECNAGSTPCRLRSARHVGARQPASKEPRPKYDFLASVPTIVIIIHVKIHEKMWNAGLFFL